MASDVVNAQLLHNVKENSNISSEILNASPSKIADDFVLQYYSVRQLFPESLYRFYRDDSLVSLTTNNKENPQSGKNSIKLLFDNQKYSDCRTSVLAHTAHLITPDTILILISGEMSNAGDSSRRFCEVFTLLRSNIDCFYVKNHMLHFQDDAGSCCNVDNAFNSIPQSESVTMTIVNEKFKESSVDTIKIEPLASTKEIVNGCDHISKTDNWRDTKKDDNNEINGQSTVVTIDDNLSRDTFTKDVSIDIDKHKNNTELELISCGNDAKPLQENWTSEPVSSGHSGIYNVEESNEKISKIQQELISNSNQPIVTEKKTWARIAESGSQGAAIIARRGSGGYVSQAVTTTTSIQNIDAESNGGLNKLQSDTVRNTNIISDEFSNSQRDDTASRSDSQSEFNGRRRSYKNFAANNGYSPNRGDSQTVNQVATSNHIFIGNLPLDCFQDELRKYFEDNFGPVLDIRINETPPSRQGPNGRINLPNYGFVTMASVEIVQNILNALPLRIRGRHRINVECRRAKSGNFNGNIVNRNDSVTQSNRSEHATPSNR